MGLLDELKKLTKPYSGEEYDDFDDEFSDEPAENPMPQEQGQRRYSHPAERRGPQPDYENSRDYESGRRSYDSGRGRESFRSYDSGRAYENNRNPDPRGHDSRSTPIPQRRDKVVNLNPANQMQMVILTPERFDSAVGIADHLKDRRPVLLNLERADKDTMRRIVDFVAGVSCALDAKVSKASSNTYMITPYNVDVMGDTVDELENASYYTNNSLY